MESNAFSFWSNIFGIITGCVSLITLVVGFRSYLPSNRIKALESLIDDTEKIFRSAVEEGLLPEATFKARASSYLSELREKSLALRSRACNITTWTQDCKELIMGLSSEIGNTCRRLKTLRAEIITSSETERRNIRNSRQATSPASPETHAAQPSDYDEASVDCSDSNSTSSTLAELPDGSDSQDTRCNTSLADADAVSDYRADATGHVSLNVTDVDGPVDRIETGTRDQTAKVDEWVSRTTIPAMRSDEYYTIHSETIPCDDPDPSGQQQIRIVVCIHPDIHLVEDRVCEIRHAYFSGLGMPVWVQRQLFS